MIIEMDFKKKLDLETELSSCFTMYKKCLPIDSDNGHEEPKIMCR